MASEKDKDLYFTQEYSDDYLINQDYICQMYGMAGPTAGNPKTISKDEIKKKLKPWFKKIGYQELKMGEACYLYEDDVEELFNLVKELYDAKV